jgi:hypothetical protein
MLIAMIFIALLVAAPLLIDAEKYRGQFLAYIKTSTGLEPAIDGKMELVLFPFPALTANNIYIYNTIEASTSNIIHVESVKATFNIFSAIAGDIKIKKLKFIRPVFEFEEFRSGKRNWDVLLDSLAKREKLSFKNLPYEVSIVNGTFSYTRELKKRSIDYVNLEFSADSSSGPFSIEGSLSSYENILSFKGGIDGFVEGAKVNLQMNTGVAEANFIGIFKDGDVPRIEGDVELNSNNIVDIMLLFFEKNSKMTQITSNEVFKLSGRFSFSKEFMSINSIVIDSESIRGVANVGLKTNFNDPKKNFEWKFNGNIARVDIDKLFHRDEDTALRGVELKEIDYYDYSLNAFNLADFRFDFSETLSASLDIKIDDVIYNQQISNFRVFVDIDKGNAIIRDISADFPGNSRLVINGSISHNGIRPLFVGGIEFGGSRLRDLLGWFDNYYSFIPQDKMKEFLFTSNLRVTPQQIDITDSSLSFDKSLLSGEFSIRPVKTIPLINAIISVDRMNLDEYNLDKKIFDAVNSFVKSTQGAMLESSWLNNFTNQINLTLNAKDVVFNDNYIRNQSTSLMLSRGLFNLQRFMIDSDASKLVMALYVDLKSNESKPELKFLLKAKLLDSLFFLQKNTSNEGADKKFQWSKNNFNFMKADEFFGDLDIEIDELRHKGVVASKVKIKGAIQDKKFDFSKETDKSYGVRASLYEGTLSMDGRMVLNEIKPSFAGVFSVSGFEMAPLLKSFKETSDVSGQLFFKGSFNTNGRSFYEWIYNLKAKAKIVLQSFRFKGFDLIEIVDKADSTYSFIDMKKTLEVATTSGQTRFEWIEGNIETDGGILRAREVKLLHDVARGLLDTNISLINSDTKSLVKLIFELSPNKKVELPFTMNGDFMNLKMNMDTRNLESYITDKGVR